VTSDAELFGELTAGAPAAPALVTEDGQAVTYGALPRRTDAWCRLLDGPGKALVVCFAGRDLATVLCYLAVLRLGHAVAMLDARISPAARDRFLTAYQPELLAWCPEDGSAPDPPAGYRHLGDVDSASVWGRSPGDRADRAEGRLHPDFALLLSTSGSTGNPKAVRLSYRNIASNSASIAASLRTTDADRVATALPLHFCYGLSVVSSHLLVGGGVAVLPQPATGRAFWRRFAEARCTGFPGVAPTYGMLSPRMSDLDQVPTLRVMTSSGSRLRTDLVLRFADYLRSRGGRLHVMYGQTEVTSRISCLDPEELPARAGSVGRAIAGGRVEIRSDGEPVPDGRRGEIVYSGPNVMLGYAESRGDLGLGDVTGGTLDTGDLGYLDDGFLYLTGRRKRIAKVYGLRISLDEIERLFEDAGTTAAVDGGDRGVLVFTDGLVEPLERARQPVATELGIPASLLTIRQVQRLPRTPNGKLDYPALTEPAPAPAPAASARVLARRRD
jgi:acyl-CoA synthetase (AMP-forming)/AMP-acid ligase II